MSSISRRPATVWIVTTGVALILVIAGTLQYVRGDYRYMRIRNALVADVGEPGDFVWPADDAPPDFRAERNVPADFRAIGNEVLGPAGSRPTALESAVRLGVHLTGDVRPRGGTVKAATRAAYGEVRNGHGNCSDFSQVYNGLALGADLPVREWGFFLDDFGGRGHAFNEIYDPQLGKWILIDTYNSFYPIDRKTVQPLSVVEFMERLAAGQGIEDLAPVAIDAAKYAANRRTDEELLDYYRGGSAQIGLWFGNDVFTYDDHPLVRAARPLPPAVEQALAILVGVHPRLRILATDANQAAIDAMFGVRNVFLAAMLLAAALAAVLAFLLVQRFRSSRTLPDPDPATDAARP